MLAQMKEKAKENPWLPISAFGGIAGIGVFKTQILDPIIVPFTRPAIEWFLGMKNGLASTGMSESAALWISVFVILFPIYESLKYRGQLLGLINHNKQFFEKGDTDEG